MLPCLTTKKHGKGQIQTCIAPTLQTANVYPKPLHNKVILLPAISQPTFYHYKVAEALNYVGI